LGRRIGASADWGGADVWLSNDNLTYRKLNHPRQDAQRHHGLDLGCCRRSRYNEPSTSTSARAAVRW
jgi:hypothetical protein